MEESARVLFYRFLVFGAFQKNHGTRRKCYNIFNYHTDVFFCEQLLHCFFFNCPYDLYTCVAFLVVADVKTKNVHMWL